MTTLSDDQIRIQLKLAPEPVAGLREDDQWIGIAGRPVAIHKQEPRFSVGWVASLRPTSRFYKRWFELPDSGKRGWAIVFHLCDEPSTDAEKAEYFAGWVPPESESLVDGWLARLNDEVRSRLAGPRAATDAADVSSEVLQWVGDFREMGYEHHPRPPSLVASRGRRSPANKTEVLAYLRGAKAVSVSPGLNRDFFEPKQFVKGDTIRTDGVYLWPDFLADYVERYDVELPAVFERHMEDRRWQLPADLDVRTLRLPW